MKTTDNQTANLCNRGYKVSSSVGLRFCNKCRLFSLKDIRCNEAQKLANDVKKKFFKVWKRKELY